MADRVLPRLIAVCGVPAAGKTTLARGLGRALHLPVVVRDDLKTGISDTFPEADWADPAVKQRLAGQAFDGFHAVVAAHLDAGSGVVAEAAWLWAISRPYVEPIFGRARTTLLCVEVDPALSAARYRARHEAGERHPAHRDGVFADEMDGDAYDWGRYVPPPDLAGRQVVVDGSQAPDAVLAAALDALDPHP